MEPVNTHAAMKLLLAQVRGPIEFMDSNCPYACRKKIFCERGKCMVMKAITPCSEKCGAREEDEKPCHRPVQSQG
jgi:hypothetical protein